MTGLTVSTQGLVHIYRTEGHDVAALSGVTLQVGAGELVGLLGPSGSGKSTLLQACAGLLRPSAGRLLIGGDDVARMSPAQLDTLRATRIGVLLQGAANNLVPYLTCGENVGYARSERERDALTAQQALELVGLPGYEDRPLSGLTPGQLQLVALAAGLAHRPALLLADEPTSQLTHAARDTVLEALVRVNSSLGTTILLVTHDPDVATRLPRTVTIRDGRIGAEGRSGEEFAVVTADGSLPLPPDVWDHVPPGTLLRVQRTEDGLLLVRADHDEEAP